MRRLSVSPNGPKQWPVFIIDIFERATFAFEAEDLSQAEAFTRAPWFKHAVKRAYSARLEKLDEILACRTRVAKVEEALLYRDLASEFGEELTDFFVVNMSGRCSGKK